MKSNNKMTVRSDPKGQYTLIEILKKGTERSVFAKYFINKGTIIECEVEMSDNPKMPLLPWDKTLVGVKSFVFCVGFGFYLKKSEDANVKIHKIDKENMKMYFEILKGIKPGEELFLQS